jgi:hypothetical protein
MAKRAELICDRGTKKTNLTKEVGGESHDADFFRFFRRRNAEWAERGFAIAVRKKRI